MYVCVCVCVCVCECYTYLISLLMRMALWWMCWCAVQWDLYQKIITVMNAKIKIRMPLPYIPSVFNSELA